MQERKGSVSTNYSPVSIQIRKSRELSRTLSKLRQSFYYELVPDDEIPNDMEVDPGSSRGSTDTSVKYILKDGNNPYLRYLQRRKVAAEEAARGPNLGTKSDEAVKNSIIEFLDWYNSLGGPVTKTRITEGTLQEMFDIGFDSPVLKKKIVYHPPEPPLSSQRSLRKGRGAMTGIAGTTDMSSETLQKLKDMTMIWDGIEELWSTLSYVEWLQNHPEAMPPPYLKKIGIMNENIKLVLKENKDMGENKDRLVLPANVQKGMKILKSNTQQNR